MTKIEIYDQIDLLTCEIEGTGISKKILNEAKRGNIKKIDKIIKIFQKKRKQTVKRIYEFSQKCSELFNEQTAIFGDGEYSIETIHILSFFILILFAEIDEINFFKNWSEYNVWLELIEKEGFQEIAMFLNEHCLKEEMELYSDISELLVDIFKVKV